MIDMGSIAAAVSSLKGASDIAKGLLSLHTMAEVQSKAIELNQAIIDAQHQIFAANAAQSALAERVRQLEGEIARMKDWDAQKERYKLAAPYPGCMVYAPQKSMSNGEPAHYICAACYQKGQRSILQGVEGRPRKEGGRLMGSYNCPNPTCKSEAFTGYMDAPAPQYFEDIKPAGLDGFA